MTRYKLLLPLLLFLALTGSSRAESRKMKWLRRSVEISSCAVSAIDGYTTNKYADGNRFREQNAFLANPDGSVKTARMIGWKTAVCAVPILVTEAHWRYAEDAKPGALIGAGLITGFLTWVDIHNKRVVDRYFAAHPEAQR